MDGFDLGDAGAELLALNKRISDLESENGRLKQIVKDNDLEDEIEDIDCTSLEEQICVKGIRYIADLVESQDFDKNDISSFQILFNTLRTIRGQKTNSTKKGKSVGLSELLQIAGKGK